TPESSGSGNVHGMPLAHLLGHGDTGFASVGGARPALHPSDVALVGLRDVDLPERRHIADWGVAAYTMRAIDERGIRAVMAEAIAAVSRATTAIWASFDIDVVDPSEAPGVGTAVPGGMTYREAHLAMELLADTGRLAGVDMVEVNPVLDVQNKTAEVAAHLVLSAFGKRIL
ncbi:MAG TPA: arginase, partial [Gemmatimonadaceae bacterium]|nr:arginase [Gemmatimonadaceae bacterium]